MSSRKVAIVHHNRSWTREITESLASFVMSRLAASDYNIGTVESLESKVDGLMLLVAGLTTILVESGIMDKDDITRYLINTYFDFELILTDKESDV